MVKIKQNDFEELINNVYQTHCILQTNAAQAVNYNLTVRNWLIGCHVVEYEQNGKDRAQYGSRLLEEIATHLKSKGLKGLHRRALNTCRLFYTTYPQIWLTLSANLPIGIILCDEKDDDLVRYSTAGMDDQMFVSKYLLKLPDKKMLESFMKRELNQ